MRTICFVICVILAAPLSAQAQEKRPKVTLLYYDHPAQNYYYYYSPELINVPEMRAGSVGMMPPGCRYSFHGIYQKRWGFPQVQQRYLVVYVGCPCGNGRNVLFKVSDTDQRFAKCNEGDE